MTIQKSNDNQLEITSQFYQDRVNEDEHPDVSASSDSTPDTSKENLPKKPVSRFEPKTDITKEVQAKVPEQVRPNREVLNEKSKVDLELVSKSVLRKEEIEGTNQHAIQTRCLESSKSKPIVSTNVEYNIQKYGK